MASTYRNVFEVKWTKSSIAMKCNQFAVINDLCVVKIVKQCYLNCVADHRKAHAEMLHHLYLPLFAIVINDNDAISATRWLVFYSLLILCVCASWKNRWWKPFGHIDPAQIIADRMIIFGICSFCRPFEAKLITTTKMNGDKWISNFDVLVISRLFEFIWLAWILKLLSFGFVCVNNALFTVKRKKRTT